MALTFSQNQSVAHPGNCRNIISQGSVHFHETFSGSPKAKKDFTEMSFTVRYYETDRLVGSLFKSLAELTSNILINLSHCTIDDI